MGTIVAIKPRPAAGPTPPPRRPALYSREDAIGQLIVEYYAHCSLDRIDAAMHQARKLLAMGATLNDTMRTVVTILDPDQTFGDRNEVLIALYTTKLHAWHERLQEVAELRICRLLSNQPSIPPGQLHAAITRARRIIDAGGHLGLAVYEAIKPWLHESKA